MDAGPPKIGVNQQHAALVGWLRVSARLVAVSVFPSDAMALVTISGARALKLVVVKRRAQAAILLYQRRIRRLADDDSGCRLFANR